MDIRGVVTAGVAMLDFVLALVVVVLALIVVGAVFVVGDIGGRVRWSGHAALDIDDFSLTSTFADTDLAPCLIECDCSGSPSGFGGETPGLSNFNFCGDGVEVVPGDDLGVKLD